VSNDLSTYVCQFSPAITTELAAAVAAAYTLEDIVDTPTCEAAVAVNTRLAKATKKAGEERLEFTRKIDAVKKRATDYEKEVCKEALTCITAVEAGINEYRSAILAEQQRRAAQAAAQEAAIVEEEVSGGEEEHVTAPLVAAEPVLDVPKIPTRKVPKALIHDLSKIPRSFFDLNEAKLLAALKLGPVDGAELAYEEVLVRR
jgi:hypothetical protein